MRKFKDNIDFEKRVKLWREYFNKEVLPYIKRKQFYIKKSERERKQKLTAIYRQIKKEQRGDPFEFARRMKKKYGKKARFREQHAKQVFEKTLQIIRNRCDKNFIKRLKGEKNS